MNKGEFIAELAKEANLTQRQARAAVGVIFNPDGIIASELRRGRRVQLTGFGTFETRKREARMGRNPQTGAQLRIPAATYPAFKAGKGFKSKIRK
jgi:DNA-binding protein HU-beta